MSLYSEFIFPRLCDFLLNRPLVVRHRRELLAEAFGEVLEIGFGTGLNLPCYPSSVGRLTTVDPNAGAQLLARKRIQASSIEVDQRLLHGESLPFQNESFDCVVSTFTLCSIAGVRETLKEVYRVLKPTGRFLFLEHGLSPEPSVQKWQRRLNGLQAWLGDGCCLDRDIRAIVMAEPFSWERFEQSYLERFPKTHGYLTRGVVGK